MLKSDSSPVKPAAIVATMRRCSSLRCVKPISGWPISEPAKISCSIGDAMPITPMPALTLRKSTAQISQNCAVLWASRRWTWPCVIMTLAPGAGGAQPSGRQPAGGSL